MKQATVPAAGNLIDADLHNFGQRVEVIEKACGLWFRKPRTAFWEWLFFGKGSPIEKYFFWTGPNGHSPLNEFIFNLEVESTHHWLGFSRKVESCSEASLLGSHFYSLGVLLAYSFIFGIRDLHRGNLVMTPTHLQVVDVEVVFARLILPNETILLPFKQVSWEGSGVGAFLPERFQLSHDHAKDLLGGYVDMFQLLIKKRVEILAVLQKIIDPTTPIRVLVRNTIEYNLSPNIHLKNDLMAEERAQLSRGDVPYFFKTLGGEDLLWLQQQDKTAVVKSLGEFKSDIDRHALSPEILLGEQLVNESRLAQGALLICRKLALSEEYLLNDKTVISNKLVRIKSVEYKIKS